MTRSDDSDTQLDSRSKIANKAKADIFVSLHRNSTANPNTTKGIEIWIHSSGSERSYAAADDILSNLEEVGIPPTEGCESEPRETAMMTMRSSETPI